MTRITSLFILLAWILGTSLQAGEMPMDTDGENHPPEELAVVQFDDQYRLRLYAMPKPQTFISRNRVVQQRGTLYWIEAERLDDGQRYAVWKRHGMFFADLRPRDFTFAKGDGDKVGFALLVSVPHFYEVDMTREITLLPDMPRDIEEELRVRLDEWQALPLSSAVEKEFEREKGIPLIHANPLRIRSLEWDEESWIIVITAAGKEWEFVRRKDDEEWRWRMLDCQEGKTP